MPLYDFSNVDNVHRRSFQVRISVMAMPTACRPMNGTVLPIVSETALDSYQRTVAVRGYAGEACALGNLSSHHSGVNKLLYLIEYACFGSLGLIQRYVTHI